MLKLIKFIYLRFFGPLLSSLFILFVTYTALNAGLHDRRVQEIKLETEELESRKNRLKTEISKDYKQEMQHEMQGQIEFVEYEWHDLGKSLKNAEASEQLAHKKEAELNNIDRALDRLREEKNSLLRQDNSETQL